MLEVFGAVFQILEQCPNQRHVLMHLTHAPQSVQLGGKDGKPKKSFLQYLVNFVSSSVFWTEYDAPSVTKLQALALRCIAQILSGSISYHSLSDFPTSGCYGSPKMDSLLTANVLSSILIALDYQPSGQYVSLEHKVVQAFCEDSDQAAEFFVGMRGALRDTIRGDETVQEFRRLLGMGVLTLQQ